MPTKMFLPRDVIRVARGELGVTEIGFTNQVKYSQWYGLIGPWCDMFVSWVLAQTENIDGYKSAYTPAGAAFWKAKNRWVTPEQLQRGDIVYFDFPGDGINRISHVGIVERVLPNGTLLCIEGNTASGTGGSQRDGGGVHRRVRPLSYVIGGGRPAYTNGAGRLPQPLLQIGSSGKTVRELQKDLRILGVPVSVTGEFDKDTAAAVRKFQTAQNLDVDGVVGPQTWGAIAKALRTVGKPAETTKAPGKGSADAAGDGKARDVEARISRKRALRLVAALEDQIEAALDELEADLKKAS